ncbi:MAG: hypothetical protein MJZ51_07730 [Bacteroidales bacterium]|nr:hypothetical protein [Bacteroidales bacterium]
MKRILLFLFVSTLSLMGFAQRAMIDKRVKALDATATNVATILGQADGDLFIATRYSLHMRSYNPIIFRLDGTTLKKKAEYKFKDQDMAIRYASLSNGKIHLLLSKNTRKEGGVYKAVVDTKTMKLDGEIESIYQNKHSRKDKLYLVAQESPDKNILALSIVFDDKDNNEFSHQIITFDNELNTLWTKNYSKLYSAMRPTNYGDVVMVDKVNGGELSISVLNETGGEDFSATLDADPESIHIVNITDGGKVLIAGTCGAGRITMSAYGASFDLEEGTLAGKFSHYFTIEEAEILNNEKPNKQQDRFVPTMSLVASAPASFGAAMSYSGVRKVIYQSNYGSSVLFDHYGLLTMAMDTMGNLMWHHCMRQSAHEYNSNLHMRYVLAERDGKVSLLVSRHPKSTDEDNAAVKNTKIKGTRGTRPKNWIYTFDQDGRHEATAFDEESKTFILSPVYDNGRDDILFFTGILSKIYLGRIQK